MLDVNTNIFFWPSCEMLRHRDMSINVAYSTEPLRTMMELITKVLEKGIRKISVHTNRVSTVNAVHKSIGKKLDKEETESNQLYSMDVLMVILPYTV